MFLVDKQITFAGEEFFQGDACQVRPMVRCPSVPFDYLYNCSRYSRTKVLRSRPLLLTVCPVVMSD